MKKSSEYKHQAAREEKHFKATKESVTKSGTKPKKNFTIVPKALPDSYEPVAFK